MAINRCLSSSSSSSSSVLNEVVVSLFHSTNGFKMSRFDQCHKNLNSRRRKFALFVTVVLLLLAVIALSLSFSLTNLRSFLVLSSPPPPFLSFSAVSSQKSSDSHLIQPEDEVTLLKDSIRQQKFELLSWLNRSHSGQINEKYHQILPLDLFVSDDNADEDTESKSKVGPGPGVFWSPVVESLLEDLDHGLHAEHHERFSKSLQNATVVSVEPGCGRSPNRLALLSDGRRLCLRYRTNADQIQGEYVSYLLARALGFAHRNVPPTALLTFDPSSSSSSSSSSSALNWAPSVASELVTGVARWTPTKAIVATSFLEHLTPAFIPPQFQQGSSSLESSSTNSSPSPPPRLHPRKEDLSFVKRKSDLLQLVQWSDLLLFDYLTANVDRLVNNRVNAQWNEQSMRSAPVHNLLRQEEENEEEKESSNEVTGSRLLFLDNESGLFHGYRLLGRFEQHHRALLGSLCIFRRGTVQRLRKLHQLREAELIQVLLTGDFNQKKKKMIKGKKEDSKTSLLPKANLRTLKRRMGTLLQQVASCQRQFGGGEGGVQ